MTTATERDCGDRVLAVIGWTVASVVVGAAVLAWVASTLTAGTSLPYVDPGVGTFALAAAGILPIPATLVLAVRLRAWRDPHRLAAVVVVLLVLGILTFGTAASLGAY